MNNGKQQSCAIYMHEQIPSCSISFSSILMVAREPYAPLIPVLIYCAIVSGGGIKCAIIDN